MPRPWHWIEGWVTLFAANRIAYEFVKFHEVRVSGDTYWFHLGFQFPWWDSSDWILLALFAVPFLITWLVLVHVPKLRLPTCSVVRGKSTEHIRYVAWPGVRCLGASGREKFYLSLATTVIGIPVTWWVLETLFALIRAIGWSVSG